MQENYTKMSNIKHYKASGRGRWGLGPLGGAGRPHLAPPRCPLAPCHITDPPQVQETHSQASSTVDSKSVHDQGSE